MNRIYEIKQAIIKDKLFRNCNIEKNDNINSISIYRYNSVYRFHIICYDKCQKYEIEASLSIRHNDHRAEIELRDLIRFNDIRDLEIKIDEFVMFCDIILRTYPVDRAIYLQGIDIQDLNEFRSKII